MISEKMKARPSGATIPRRNAERSRIRCFRSLAAMRVAADISVAQRLAGEMEEYRLEIWFGHLDPGHGDPVVGDGSQGIRQH